MIFKKIILTSILFVLVIIGFGSCYVLNPDKFIDTLSKSKVITANTNIGKININSRF